MTFTPKRATVYFDPRLHTALRLKAAELDRSISELVNEMVQRSLAEDAEDLASFRDRAAESVVSYEAVLKDLQQHGRL